MRFQGALIKEQGITFAIVIVKPHVVQHTPTAQDTIRAFQPAFPGVPVVLMAQDARGTPTYFGRRDLVNFLSRVSLGRIPWREYTLG